MDGTNENSGVPRAAGKIWLSMLVCVGVWLVLAAPRLHRTASASPEGMRRTIALAVLEPVRWFSESSGAADLAAAVETFAGKDLDHQPGGELDVADILDREGFEVPPRRDDIPRRSPPESRKRERKEKPVRLREPTASRRLRVAVIGDSLADGIVEAIERALAPRLTHVLSVGRIATGLARSDYFDWVTAMRNIERRYRPDVVIVMIGGNDKQSVVFPGGRAVISGDPGWGKAYRERIDELIAEMGGANLIWIGLPPVKDRGESGVFRDLNRIYDAAVDGYRKGRYVDIWDTFADKDGRYRAFGRGPSGDTELLRAGDGEHFTAAGYDLIADRVISVMSSWGLPKQALR